jgi:hypothetical protein
MPARTTLVPDTMTFCTEYCTSWLCNVLPRATGRVHWSQVVPDGRRLAVWPVSLRTVTFAICAGYSARPCWSVKRGVTGHQTENAAVMV